MPHRRPCGFKHAWDVNVRLHCDDVDATRCKVGMGWDANVQSAPRDDVDATRCSVGALWDINVRLQVATMLMLACRHHGIFSKMELLKIVDDRMEVSMTIRGSIVFNEAPHHRPWCC